MRCFFCNSDDTQVIDTRLSDDKFVVKRRRRCHTCDKRFNTLETIDIQMPAIIKADGSREEFNEKKIKNGFIKALHKRPVSLIDVDSAVDTIRQNILNLGIREIESRKVGDMVMAELAKLDKVAYIRFASIYGSFTDVNDFSKLIKQVK